MFRTTVRRGLTAGAAAVAAVALGAVPAMAHHCFIPMYTLEGPTSANWMVFSAEMGADLEAGYVTECDAARQAGYDALEAAGLPVGIKIFAKMTIGDPKETGRMAPNGANGKGLEYFGAGSELPMQMVGTYIGAASQVDCG
ncbi:hypothetical protein [Ornithinimicrobium tianjinense]|uniref:Uncharacterized protein n=1 Tax=Ornithinimicrobium tianjinense TaxID=1195761 RepID=A0A917F619_9MICO|nr:hypothetical protein [Ornithinimicrobium tianjinense]GGF47235.1 hypothetical protein GCM10011366_13760 [Ornithinimicrobium tianjinense]